MRTETRGRGALFTRRSARPLGVVLFFGLAILLGASIARGELGQVALLAGGATVMLTAGWIIQRPYLGLGAFILYQFAIPMAAIEDHAILGRLGLLIAAATIGMYALARLIDDRRLTLPVLQPLEWVALIFLLGMTIATAISGEARTPVGRSSWQLAGSFYRSALLATLFLLTVRRFEALTTLTRFLLAASLAYALYGLLPGVTGVYQGEEGPGRITGLHHDPNYYAFYLVFPMLVALTLLVRRTGSDRWLSIAVVVCGGLSLILSFSRGAWISVIAGLAYLLMRDRLRLRTLAVGLTLCLVVWLLFGELVLQRFEGVGDLSARSNSVVSRLYAANAGWRMFCSHWIAGVGLGEFKAHVMSFGDAFLRGQMQIVAHNAYIQMLAEVGLIGGGTYLAFLALLFFQLRAASRIALQRRASEAPLILAFEVGIVGTFVGMSSLSLGGHYREWIFLALAAVAIRLVSEGRLHVDEPVRQSEEGAR